MKQTNQKGFTLIELLVVIAVIGILAAILVPAVTKVIEDAKWTEMKSNGKNIYTSVFADAVDNGQIGFPEVVDGSARKYFAIMAGEDMRAGLTATTILASGPDYYAGPGVKPAPTWADFKTDEKYCAWNAVAGKTETADAGTPFLISRNLTALPASFNTSVIGTGAIDATMGDDRICVAFHGAGSEVFKVEQAKNIAMNQPDSTIAATDFLRP